MLTVREVAALLKVAPSTVYALASGGRLISHRIGLGRGAIRFAEDDVTDFLRSSRTESREEVGESPTRRRLQRLRHLKHPK
jgi:excisionase family DNA binding protein